MYLHVQMSHSLGNNVLIAHAFGKDTILQHTLNEWHLPAVTINANFTGLDIGTSLIQTVTDELQNNTSEGTR